MPKVAQLVSRNTALIEAVEKFSQPLHNLQLEIRRDCLDVLSQVQREDISVYIFHLPDHENLQEMAQVVKKVTSSSQAVVLVVSSEYQDDLAVTLLRAGATDYFGIKTDLCKLRNSLEMVSRAGFCDGSKNKALRRSVGATTDPFAYVLSPEMVEMMDQVRRVAPQETTLFLSGETGTGKTQLAKLIHELSPRAVSGGGLRGAVRRLDGKRNLRS